MKVTDVKSSSTKAAGKGKSCTAVEAVGNPIFPGTGNKFQQEVDYRGPRGLSFVRRYNSSLPGWVHNYSVRVLATASLARVIRPDGRAHLFTGSGAGQWVGEAAAQEQLIRLVQSDASQPAWKYVTANDTVELYDGKGRLMSVSPRGGLSYTVEQQGGLIRSIRDLFGNRLQFGYDAQNRLVALTTPEGTSLAYGYDTQGRLAQVSYPDGTNRKYLYENSTYPLALTGLIDESGILLATWSYDAAGRAVSSEHAGGVDRFQLTYNADGSTAIVDPLNTTRTQRYASAGARKVFGGQSQPCADCVGDAASTTVDSATGLLAASIDYLGITTLFTNDSQRKLPLSVSKAVGRPEAQQVDIQWHPSFRLPALVTEAGRTTAYAYDALGNKLSETITDLASNLARTWQWSFTSQGLVDSMIDPKGAVWRYAYDGAGNRSSVINPLGQQTSYSYDAAGRVTGQTDPNGLTTSFAYDARGRLTQQVRGGEANVYVYTLTGQLASALLPSGYQVSYSYDAAQRLVGASDNRGATIQYTLDAAGNRTREEVKDATGAIAMVTGRIINTLSQVAAIQGAAGQTTALGYDANGQPISQTDPLNQTTRQTLDGLRRPVLTTFADNASASQAWNQLDQLTVVTDPKGVATRFQTNAFGEVTTETSPDTGAMRYQRDAAGDLSGMADAVGNQATIERDALGRPTRIQYAADHLATFSYDQGQTGYLNKIDDPSGITSYERDAQGRVLGKQQSVNDNTLSPSQYKVQYGYTNGELASVAYPSGLKVFYRRTAGRITGIDMQMRASNPLRPSPVVSFVTGLTHTALGQPKAWAWSSGDRASRSFDTDGRMTGSEIASYVYDAASRITGITQNLWVSSDSNSKAKGTSTSYTTPLTWSAGYDSRNRLTSLARDGSSTQYSYDANSNRLTAIDKTTSDTDLAGLFDQDDFIQTTIQVSNLDAASNRLLGFTQTLTQVHGGKTKSVVTPINYTLDANGALTSDGLRSFEYDASRRLSQVKVFRDGEAAKVAYLHNALGQRVFKSEPQSDQTQPDEARLGEGFVQWLRTNFGWLFEPAETKAKSKSSIGTAFVYDEQANLLGEYDNGSAAGKGSQEYIWLPTEGGQAIPIGIHRNGRTFAVHADHLGTPRLITDEENKPVWQWPYSAFGNNKPVGVLKATAGAKAGTANQPMQLKATKPDIEANLRFPGQYFDEESNLNYNYFRSYQAGTGRYTQPDPIGLDGGLNRFVYVDGNPLRNVDRLGLDWYRAPNSTQEYSVGRDETIVRPGGLISKFIEFCIPAGRTFGEIHDARVDEMTSKGHSDWRANIPTMPAAYLDAVKLETGRSLLQLERDVKNLYRR